MPIDLGSLLRPEVLLSRLLILLIALPIHELAHAFIAYRLGDVTARDYGRLSFNPLDHLDPIGAIMILLGGFGWAKPVPVNPYGLYRSRNSTVGFALVALAGPMSNLALAALFAIPFRLDLISLVGASSGSTNALVTFGEGLLYNFIVVNIALAVFNLIPIPPLDGSRIAVAILPPQWGEYILRLEQYGIMIVLALVFLGVIGLLMGPPMSFLERLILGF
jgi:Zn-dependent protease